MLPEKFADMAAFSLEQRAIRVRLQREGRVSEENMAFLAMKDPTLIHPPKKKILKPKKK